MLHSLFAVVTLLFLASCSQERGDSVRLVVGEDQVALYAYQIWAEPPDGVGWKFRVGRPCGEKQESSPQGLVVQTSRLDSSEYGVVEKLEPRDFLSDRTLSSVWMFGDVNPFSDIQGVSLRMERGTLKVTPVLDDENSPTDLLRPKAVKVELAGYIDPDKFRNVECQFVSPDDDVIENVKCRCLNARGEDRDCNMIGVGSTTDLGRACCEQLNADSPKYVRIEASFTATYCSDYCSASSPGLLHRWCPKNEGTR